MNPWFYLLPSAVFAVPTRLLVELLSRASR
jgi:hypothetical protein